MMKLIKLILFIACLVALPVAFGTVSNQNVRTVTATGDGVTTSYTIGFSFKNNSEIVVYKITDASGAATLLSQGSGTLGYSITGGNPGTTVVVVTAPTSSEHLLIYRNTALTQSVSYSANSAFPASNHEAEMDRAVQRAQEFYQYTPSYPRYATPANGDILKYDGSTWQLYNLNAIASSGIVGSGGVSDNAVTRWNGTTGASIQSSVVSIDDTGIINDPALTASRVVITDANKNISTSTTAIGDLQNATAIQGKTVNTSALGDQRPLVYNTATGQIKYSTTSTVAMVIAAHTTAPQNEAINRVWIDQSTNTIIRQNGDWVSSIAHPSTGTTTITFKSNYWFETPTCVATGDYGAGSIAIVNGSGSASSMQFIQFRTDTLAAVDQFLALICMGKVN